MAALSGTNVEVWDVVVIVGYFVLVLTVGLMASLKNRGSVGGYFLAGRNMHWIPLGASLFASNIGSLHFVGLAGSGAGAGLAVANYELNAIIVNIILGWIFLPVYIASGVFTMPEYMQKRFGGQRIQVSLALLSMAVYIFTKISADLFAGAIFIEQALGWNMYVAMVLLLGIAAIFTITGGLTAVIWTDFIQTLIMMVGATALMIICFTEVGGYQEMMRKYGSAIPNSTLVGNDSCGYPRDDYMHLLRDPLTGDIPWPGILGLTIPSIWYWCADQVIVQRSLSGKNYSHSKAGNILTGYLKILPMFLIIMPGMISRILYPNEIACASPEACEEVCGSSIGCTNIAYPMLVLKLMPQGARGVMLAVMLSALMSSLTSIFNSSSTIFTMDIWRRIHKKAGYVELMVVGRLCVVVVVVISLLWVPIIRAFQGSQLFVYIQVVSSYFQPPICAVYLAALFWKRLNEPGAFWGLVVGIGAGITRFILDFIYPSPQCWDEIDTRPGMIKNFHYLYFAIFIFFLTLGVAAVVSMLTKPIPDEYLYRLTFWTRFSKHPRVDIDTGKLEEDLEMTDLNLEETKLPDGDNNGVNGAVSETEITTVNGKLKDVNDVQFKGVPIWKKMAHWICGIEGHENDQTEAQRQRGLQDQHQSLDENPRIKSILDFNAMFLLMIAAFLTGFFH